jgi:hypothetical protein
MRNPETTNLIDGISMKPGQLTAAVYIRAEFYRCRFVNPNPLSQNQFHPDNAGYPIPWIKKLLDGIDLVEIERFP